MKSLRLLIAVTLTMTPPFAMAEQIVMESPRTAMTLRYADRYASAFYTVDREIYRVVLAFSVGPENNAQLIRQTFQLTDGQSYRLSIGGYGKNEQATTISMTRQHDHILADVVTCESKSSMANCI
jgi:hypothetical protein